jgi:hypothetical protein
MGLWTGRCSLLFFLPKVGLHRLRYVPPNDRLYNGCRLYFKEVADADHVMVFSGSQMSFRARDSNDRFNAIQRI